MFCDLWVRWKVFESLKRWASASPVERMFILRCCAGPCQNLLQSGSIYSWSWYYEFDLRIRLGIIELIALSAEVWQIWHELLIERAILEQDDETPLPGSRRRHFIFLSPLSFIVCYLMWFCIRSSRSFSLFRGARLSAFTFNGVHLPCNVPKFAMSFFLTVTRALPGSLMLDVIGLTIKISDPGANTSESPSRVFLKRPFHDSSGTFPPELLFRRLAMACTIQIIELSILRPYFVFLDRLRLSSPESCPFPPLHRFYIQYSVFHLVEWIRERLCFHLKNSL